MDAKNSIEEREANYFAMCLLMPDQFCEQYYVEHPLEELSDLAGYVKAMAETFQVEESLVMVRLAHDGMFGNKPF